MTNPRKAAKDKGRTDGAALSGPHEPRPLAVVAAVAAAGAVAGALVLGMKRAAASGATAEAASLNSIPQIAGYLQEHLGREVTAYLSGVDNLRLVGRWVKGKAQPRDLPGQRLRFAYEATRVLVDAYDSQTARAWFFGMNPVLDDEAPAYVLRNGERPEDWDLVVPAAMEFVGT